MTKYRAVRTEVGGITFASKAEAKRYSQLKLLEKAGEIKNLQLQPKFPLTATRGKTITKIGNYIADFSYTENGGLVVEDVKGFKTPLYRWKKKHFEAEYNIKLREIT